MKRAEFSARNPTLLRVQSPANEKQGENELELLETDLGQRRSRKRNGVRFEGYESDSSSNDDDGGAAAAGTGKSTAIKRKRPIDNEEEGDDDDDDDMFANDDKPPEGEGGEGEEEEEVNDKKVRLLDITEIEGQDFESVNQRYDRTLLKEGKGKGVDNASSSESELAFDDQDGHDTRYDDINADEQQKEQIAKSKLRGPKIEAFNMKKDLEEGQFDQEGNYIRKAQDDEGIHQDVWLSGVSKRDIRIARESEEKRRQQERNEILNRGKELTLHQSLESLIDNLERGENALEALQRLAATAAAKKSTSKSKKNAKNNPLPSDPLAEQERKRKIETITEAADKLLQKGFTDAYENERELLTRLYKRETGEEYREKQQEQPPHTNEWEFHWKGHPDTVHGPYPSHQMQSWKDSYFDDRVLVRQSGADDFLPVDEVRFL